MFEGNLMIKRLIGRVLSFLVVLSIGIGLLEGQQQNTLYQILATNVPFSNGYVSPTVSNIGQGTHTFKVDLINNGGTCGSNSVQFTAQGSYDNTTFFSFAVIGSWLGISTVIPSSFSNTVYGLFPYIRVGITGNMVNCNGTISYSGGIQAFPSEYSFNNGKGVFQYLVAFIPTAVASGNVTILDHANVPSGFRYVVYGYSLTASVTGPVNMSVGCANGSTNAFTSCINAYAAGTGIPTINHTGLPIGTTITIPPSITPLMILDPTMNLVYLGGGLGTNNLTGEVWFRLEPI